MRFKTNGFYIADGIWKVPATLSHGSGDNASGYRDGSPITFAKQLKGNLLLVHGTGDFGILFSV